MIHKIKSKFKSEDHKRLLSNFLSLSVLQGMNYILPLISLPYLVRVLGVEYFGLLAFATALITYFNIIADYGFNLTATREIAINNDNRDKVIEIFSSVILIKMILVLTTFLLMLIIVFSFEKFSQHWYIYFLTFGTVLGQSLFPVWFFQGMQEMKYITYLNVLSKSFFTILIFVIIQSEEDYYFVPLLTSLGAIIVGVWSLYIIRKKFNIYFRLQKSVTLKFYIKEAHYIFISNISVSLYTLTTIFLLGIFTNNVIVGYYAIADKLMNAIKSLISPISQTLYPYISNNAMNSKEVALSIVKNISIYLIVGGFILVGTLFIYAKEIIFFTFAIESEYTVLIFKILIIVPFLVVLDTLFGTLIMLVFKKNKEYSQIITLAGALNLVIALILIPLYQGIGAAVSVLIIEVFITLRIIWYIENNDLSIIRKSKTDEK